MLHYFSFTIQLALLRVLM